jgi:hypothetical protein
MRSIRPVLPRPRTGERPWPTSSLSITRRALPARLQRFRAVITAGLANDIAAAPAASPAAGAFFDTLAQFYRKACLRWIDATARRPDVRAARIAEVADLLAARIKQRPRS